MDAILRPGSGDRKARTSEELQAALAEPRGPAPSRTLWMHESLLDKACRPWEQMATHLGYQATDRRQDPADSP